MVLKVNIEIPGGSFQWIFSAFCNHSEPISHPLEKFGSYSLGVGVLPTFLLPLHRSDCLLTLGKQVPLLWQRHSHQHKLVLQDKGRRGPNWELKQGGWVVTWPESDAALPRLG